MRKAVFLDRDGVINQSLFQGNKPLAPLLFQDFKLIPRSDEAVHQLKQAGFHCFIFTNQPDLTKGTLTVFELEKMHQFLRQTMPFDDIAICHHSEQEKCLCRKPKPGMITKLAKKWSIDLNHSFVIGDRWRDIEAGEQAKTKTILIGDGYQEKKISPDYTFPSLWEASQFLILL